MVIEAGQRLAKEFVFLVKDSNFGKTEIQTDPQKGVHHGVNFAMRIKQTLGLGRQNPEQLVRPQDAVVGTTLDCC